MVSLSALALKRWLDANGATKRALAEELDLDPSYLVHLVAGRRIPSLAVAYALADRCGIDPRTWRVSQRRRRAA